MDLSGWKPAICSCLALAAISLAIGGCTSSTSAPLACSAKAPVGTTSGTGQVPGETGGAANPAVATGWTLPGGNQQSTRDVSSPITAANVASLGVAWTIPLSMPAAHTDGAYATTPVIVNGVVYVQDLDSNVMAISLATGTILWRHTYDSENGGPDGVTVADGVVYAATSTAAGALSAATGAQLWTRTLTRNDHEGIDTAPGYNNGTVYISTVPVSPALGEYLGGAKGTLWALNAATGAPEWSWDEVQNLWGKPSINSGGGQWYPPSFDAQGNIYLGVGNPAPLEGTPAYPYGSSRPGPDLYTDSIVKLSPAGKLLWYYQLTPHDLYDWDMQNSPVLTSVNGQPAVIDGGKAGILIALNAQTGKLTWKLPVGLHNGHDNDGLITEHATPTSHVNLPRQFCLEPSVDGGIETQLASNGSTTFAAVNDLVSPVCPAGTGCNISQSAAIEEVFKAGGEMVAVNQASGKVEWDTGLPSSPYGAATVTNNVVFTTTFSGHLYALNAATGAVLLTTPLSAGTNAPVAVDGDYVIAGAGAPLTRAQQPMIIAYKLGGTGKLPDSVGP